MNKITQILTNGDIYNKVQAIMSTDIMNLEFPVNPGFYINKNLQSLIDEAQKIEEYRIKIIQKYGEPNVENNTYTLSPENIELAQNELNSLWNITQEYEFYQVDLEVFANLSLSLEQINLLSFMIEGV